MQWAGSPLLSLFSFIGVRHRYAQHRMLQSASHEVGIACCYLYLYCSRSLIASLSFSLFLCLHCFRNVRVRLRYCSCSCCSILIFNCVEGWARCRCNKGVECINRGLIYAWFVRCLDRGREAWFRIRLFLGVVYRWDYEFERMVWIISIVSFFAEKLRRFNVFEIK